MKEQRSSDSNAPLSQSRLRQWFIHTGDLDKRAFVRKQTEQAMDKGRPFVRCGCLKKLRMPEAYKCLYCGEWYCAPCAEIHFGKTRAEYQAEKEQRRCSGYRVFPDGEKCNGCPDCQQQV